MTLTAEQLADLRIDMGNVDATDFTDDQLQRLYVRAGSSYEATVRLGLRQLLARIAGQVDYKAGETYERRSQRYAQLLALLEYWDAKTDGSAGDMLMIGSYAVPTVDREAPVEPVHGGRNMWPRRRR